MTFRNDYVLRILAVAWGVSTLVMVLVIANAQRPTWGALLFALPGSFAFWLVRRSRVDIESDRVCVVNGMRRFEFEIDQVSRFEVRAGASYGRRVHLILRDGRVLALAALECSWGMACERLVALAGSMTQHLKRLQSRDSI